MPSPGSSRSAGRNRARAWAASRTRRRPAPWCRRRLPGRRRRLGARSCRSRARACGRPIPLPYGTLETCHSYPSSFPTRPSPPSGDCRPPAPLRRQDRVGPLLSPLPSRLLRSRVSRPNFYGEPDDATRNGPGWGRELTPKTQALDQGVVALAVPGLEIIEQPAALADHLEQATARMMILRVALEVLGEIGDAFAQDGDLNLR